MERKEKKQKQKKNPTTPTVVPQDWQKVVLRATGLCFSIVVVIMTHTNTPRMLSGNLLQLKMTETESNHAGTSEKGLEEFLSLKLNGRAQVLKKTTSHHSSFPNFILGTMQSDKFCFSGYYQTQTHPSDYQTERTA